MNNKKTMIIMTGSSGSGKTTLSECIQSLSPYEVTICSADHYFYNNGKYEFDRTKLKDAHAFSIINCKNACENEIPVIIVDNTNTQEWEMKPYNELANKHGYIVHNIVIRHTHGGSNTHGVPNEVLSAQRERIRSLF